MRTILSPMHNLAQKLFPSPGSGDLKTILNFLKLFRGFSWVPYVGLLLVISCGGGTETGERSPGIPEVLDDTNTSNSNFFKKPVDDEKDVPLSSEILVFFNQELDPITIHSATFFIRKKDSTEKVPSTISYTPLDFNNSIPPFATLKPNDPLEYSTDYRVTLTAGIKSKDGISLKPVEWVFTTTQNPDSTPPQFGGLKKATMKNAKTITLEWEPATDNVDDPSQIVYDICFVIVAIDPDTGEEIGEGFCPQLFDSPAVEIRTSDPGAISYDVINLPINTDFYFLVRARDRAGNRDQNEDELRAGLTINLGRLYIANGNGEEILAFNNPTLINKDASFDSKIAAKHTTLGNPNGLFIDNNNKELYVTNFLNNTVAVYDITDPLSPGVYPKRLLFGPDTTLSGPTGIFVDTALNKLYVTNIISNTIAIFNNASTISGNVAPNKTVGGDLTTLNQPQGIRVTGTDIFVSNTAGNSILIFDEASISANPNTSAYKMIKGSSTSLSAPVGLALSPTQVYVANRDNNSITSYNLADIQICTTDECLEGNFSPAKQIIREIDSDGNTVSDLTGLFFPRQIFLDLNDPFESGGVLYVSNTGNDKILIFKNISPPSTNGNVASLEFPTVPSPNINGPRGLNIYRASQSSPPFLFLASQESNQIHVFPLGNLSNPTPIATIIPIKTNLIDPLGVYLDSRNDSLYVTNFAGNAIMVFESPHLITNNLTPSRVIVGNLTKLNGPTGIFVDEKNDILYIANLNDHSVLSFENASVLSGNVQPDRDIRGFLSRILNPISLFVTPDPQNPNEELLFISNRGGNNQTTVPPEILVFENARKVGDTISSPARILAGPLTGLNNPISIFVDSLHDLLYVSNREGVLPLGGSISVFSNASAIDGDQQPDRTYHFKNNQRFEIRPNGITVQSLANGITNRIYFSNEGTPESVFGVLPEGKRIPPSIIIFEENLSSPGTGTILHPISAIIQVGTQSLTSQNFSNRPYGIALDNRSGINDSLYVADFLADSISIFSGASTLSSNGIISPVPNNKIPFSLESPRWLALDISPDELYVSSYGNNALVGFRNASLISGDVNPLKTIMGENTRIDKPQGLVLSRKRDTTTFDLTEDRIYLANEGTASILVFDGVTNLNGDVPPAFEMTSSFLISSSQLRGLAYSTNNDLLYVADKGQKTGNNQTVSNTGRILIFQNTSTLSSDANETPIMVLDNFDFFLDQPIGLFLEEVNDGNVNDRLYIADYPNNQIVVVDLEVTADANNNKSISILNFRIIGSSSSSLLYPVGVFVHPGINHLYTSGFPPTNSSRPIGNITVFNNASEADGIFPPIQEIKGGNTNLNLPFGIVLDTTRNVFK